MKVITREAVIAWLDTLRQEYTVIAPQAVEGSSLTACGAVEDKHLYRPVAAAADVAFDFQRTLLPAKAYFLPETETLFEMHKRGREVALTEPAIDRQQVIWGVRPCDARALRVLDALLLDRPPADAYYSERRAGTTLVGLACPRLWDGCFCTSLGGAPDDASDVDLMLYEGEAGYRLAVVTDRGARLLEGLALEDVEEAAPPSDRGGEVLPALVPPAAWGALFDDPLWQQLAERCLSCHACTYACPTCRCFDVRDDTAASGPGYLHIRRLRAWDSCMATAYQRIAGGHNPRPAKMQRLRNRYYCKFCYSALDFGTVACVGCGRCLAVCPAGVDIAEMLAGVARRGGAGDGQSAA